MNSIGPITVIIGTGPAAVSVAWPLAETGQKVLMLEAGEIGDARVASQPTSLPASRGGSQTSEGLGDFRLDSLRDAGMVSPKLRTAAPAGFGDDYQELLRMRTTGFRAVGAFAAGGLTQLWGGAVSTFIESDFGAGVSIDEMKKSYRRVGARIGLSGERLSLSLGLATDLPLQPPVPLSPISGSLLATAQTRKAHSRLDLSRPILAVRTIADGDAGCCVACRRCMWGCTAKAIYNASDELPALIATGNVEVRSRSRVTAITRDNEMWRIELSDGSRIVTHQLVVAAGVLSTTSLLHRLTERPSAALTLLNNPAFAFAAFLPARIGKALPLAGFGLSQLSFSWALENGENDSAYGLIYDAETMPAADILTHIPLTRPGAMSLLRLLAPGLVVGLGYFPGSFSQNSISFDDDGAMHIHGGVQPSLADARKDLRRNLPRELLRMGAIMLPGSLKDYEPGAEVHYAGTLAMGRFTTTDGEMIGCPNLYVADGSILPILPSRSHTFTVMANADRIGRALARKTLAA